MRKKSSVFIILGCLTSLIESLALDLPQSINGSVNLYSNSFLISGGQPSALDRTSPSTNRASSSLALNLSLVAPGDAGYECDKEQFGSPMPSSCNDAIRQMPGSRNMQTYGDQSSQVTYNIRLPLRYSSGS